MKRMIQGAAALGAVTGLVAVGTVPAHAAAGDAAGESTYTASAAFAQAAQQPETNQEVEPAAIPAVVGTAFVTGAAAGAGKVVAGWAAQKIIGTWELPEATLEMTQLD